MEVFYRQPQAPVSSGIQWVVILRRHCFITVLLNLCLLKSFVPSSGKSLSNEEHSQTFRENIGDIYCFPQRFRENYAGLVQSDPSSVTSVGQGKAVGSVGGLQ